MTSYLLIYDRRAGKIRDLRQFREADREKAQQERFALELLEREHPDVEVVLLDAESLEDLKATYRRYFATARQLVTTLAAVKFAAT